MLPKTVIIKKIIKENTEVKTFVLGESIEALPGQYLMIWLPGVDEKPISIVCPNPLTITVAKVGIFSQALHKLKSGGKIGYRGPLGRGFKIIGKKMLLVAGGYGVAPLYFLAKEALKKKRKVFVILGAEKKDKLLFEQKFRRLKTRVFITTDNGSYGRKGLATDLVEEIIKKEKIDTVYSCGPEKMMVILGKICQSLKIPCFLSIERFMKCGGLGVCGHCEINGILVCQKGPVFDYKFLKKLPNFGRFRRDQSGIKIKL
jgi:dihydroorotate dehydrogenase electron transfer subunit